MYLAKVYVNFRLQLYFLVRLAVSQLAVIGSPIGQHIIGPASSRFARSRRSMSVLPKTALQGNRTDIFLSSQWQITCNNTCTGSVHPNTTPAGLVQDGNNNCPSYARNAQSLH